jgi:hypothetical protein
MNDYPLNGIDYASCTAAQWHGDFGGDYGERKSTFQMAGSDDMKKAGTAQIDDKPKEFLFPTNISGPQPQCVIPVSPSARPSGGFIQRPVFNGCTSAMRK